MAEKPLFLQKIDEVQSVVSKIEEKNDIAYSVMSQLINEVASLRRELDIEKGVLTYLADYLSAYDQTLPGELRDRLGKDVVVLQKNRRVQQIELAVKSKKLEATDEITDTSVIVVDEFMSGEIFLEYVVTNMAQLSSGVQKELIGKAIGFEFSTTQKNSFKIVGIYRTLADGKE